MNASRTLSGYGECVPETSEVCVVQKYETCEKTFYQDEINKRIRGEQFNIPLSRKAPCFRLPEAVGICCPPSVGNDQLPNSNHVRFVPLRHFVLVLV